MYNYTVKLTKNY